MKTKTRLSSDLKRNGFFSLIELTGPIALMLLSFTGPTAIAEPVEIQLRKTNNLKIVLVREIPRQKISRSPLSGSMMDQALAEQKAIERNFQFSFSSDLPSERHEIALVNPSEAIKRSSNQNQLPRRIGMALGSL